MEVYQLNGFYYIPFSTRNPNTGVAQHADSLPVASIYKEDEAAPTLSSPQLFLTVNQLAAAGQYTLALVTHSTLGCELGSHHSVRVKATVDGVTDEAQIESFRVAAGAWDLSTVPEGVWTYDFAGDTKLAGLVAWQLLAFSAIGAGIGQVDTGVPDPGSSRDETFAYPDGVTDAFVVTADAEGNRTTINLAP